MSPDRTIAALRREVYLRKPEVFKMACLRDIKNLFGPGRTPFYAGFGNRLTDALSYRSVSIPSNRIFTINSYAEVSLDLLSLNKLRLSYVNMREVVDHYFPPVSQLLQQGGEDFTDFNYWRDRPMDLDEFSDSDSEGGDAAGGGGDSGSDAGSEGGSEDERDEEEGAGMRDSYISQASVDGESIMSQSEDDEDEDGGPYDEEEEGSQMTSSLVYESATMLGAGEEEPLSAAQIAAQLDYDMEQEEDEGGDTFPIEASPTPLAEKTLEQAEFKVSADDKAELLTPARPSMDRAVSRGEYSEDHDAEIISGMRGVMIRDESRAGSRAPSVDGSKAGSRAGSRQGGERRRRAESNVSRGSVQE